MTSAFFGLELALRALQTQQVALDVTNHNVANANTPGFSRQSAVLATTTPYTLPGFNRAPGAGQLGTGVWAAAIERARDGFLDIQYRAEVSTQRQAEVARDALEEVQVVLHEPSDTGISALLGSFFGAWQALASDPSDSATRNVVVQQASALAAGFNRATQQLSTIQQRLNDEVALTATEINSLTSQLTALNRQIVQVESLGQRANDLRDQRDLLLDRLAELVPVATVENSNGSVDVTLGGHALVTGTTADTLTATPTGPGGLWEVRFASDSVVVSATSGRLKGLLDVRDGNIPSYRASLDTLANTLITAVNGLHTTGYGLDGVTGRPFFAGTDAATIAVDPTISADPRRVAAADAPNEASNNAVALALAQLRHTMSPPPESAYSALITGLGTDARGTQALAENQALLVQHIERRRQVVSGVSLDEETVNLLRYQRAYEAAARLITANDEMLDKLINETGIVGR